MTMRADTQFTSRSAEATLRAVCAALGLDATGAEMLRFGQNAIYQLRAQPYVIRIARTAEPADVLTEVRVAQWLAEHDFPATRLADLGHVEQPIEADGRLVTVWDLVRQSSQRPAIADLGRILRGLHRLVPSASLDLPAFTPFPALAARLPAAPASVSEDDVAFLEQRAGELAEEYAGLSFELPQGPIHGDAHLGNLMRAESGAVILGDLECFAIGPREWDITPPAAYRFGFGWLDDAEYQAFVDAYGYDVARAPCFPVLRAIRELNMTAWLMQIVDESEEIRSEFRRRMSDLRDPAVPRRWRRF